VVVLGDSGGNGAVEDAGLKLRMRGEERRISSQHRQLEELFAEVLASLQNGGVRKGISDFLLFSTALEAHMSVEEDIYFPALHGLRSDVGPELEALMNDHQGLRAKVARIREMLTQEDKRLGLEALDELAADIGQHEGQEEELIARITEGPVTSLGHTTLES
jgi:Hemerythrin HHE cation binding domain